MASLAGCFLDCSVPAQTLWGFSNGGSVKLGFALRHKLDWGGLTIWIRGHGNSLTMLVVVNDVGEAIAG